MERSATDSGETVELLCVVPKVSVELLASDDKFKKQISRWDHCIEMPDGRTLVVHDGKLTWDNPDPARQPHDNGSETHDEPPDPRRRVALWELLAASRGELPLAPVSESPVPSGLIPLKPVELTETDFRVTGLSLNAHPMKHLRDTLKLNQVRTTTNLRDTGKNGERVACAGLVICRQRPGTAKGFVFLTLEDETGMLNIIIEPKRFEPHAMLISTSPLLLIRGVLPVVQGVMNLRAEKFRALQAESGEEYAKGRNFH